MQQRRLAGLQRPVVDAGRRRAPSGALIDGIRHHSGPIVAVALMSDLR
jgi:hypothetical protein